MTAHQLIQPWCELILGVDSANEYVYYLSNEKKPTKQSQQFKTDNKMLHTMINDIKTNGRAMIVKYSLTRGEEVKRCYI